MKISTISVLPVKASLIKRERLFTKLDDHDARQLLVLSAGTGYGKTTLISSYIVTAGI